MSLFPATRATHIYDSGMPVRAMNVLKGQENLNILTLGDLLDAFRVTDDEIMEMTTYFNDLNSTTPRCYWRIVTKLKRLRGCGSSTALDILQAVATKAQKEVTQFKTHPDVALPLHALRGDLKTIRDTLTSIHAFIESMEDRLTGIEAQLDRIEGKQP